MSVPSGYDAVIVGAGHNGLTAAAYLAKAGLEVLVLERRHVVGGAALTEEFHPGFKASAAAYVVSLLREEVVADLELHRHGYRTIPLDHHAVQLADGRYLLLTGDVAHDRAEVGKFSNRDWESYLAFEAELGAVAEVLRRWMLRAPPDLAGGWASLWRGLRLGADMRALTGSQRRLLAQLLSSPPSAILNRWFESEVMRIKLASSITIANPVSLQQSGSNFGLLHLSAGAVDGRRGQWALAEGGMGAITEAMAASARARGATIRTEAPVRRIRIDSGRATGVELDDGERIAARVVLASTDPKRTFLGLVGVERLDPDFAADLELWRQDSGSFRVNLALEGTPRFNGVPPEVQRAMLEAMTVMAPSLDAFERAYWSSRHGELPRPPIIDVHFPTALDGSLAPEGCHVASIIAQHYPFALSGGRRWEAVRDQAVTELVDALEIYVPNIKEVLIGWRAYSPWDLESVFGLTGGDVYHGRLDADQIFSLRPHPRAADYRTPVRNLYLCGAGAHPGGGVSGAPGHNAAQRVLRDL